MAGKGMRECECGCGGFTKSRFVPGHDAKMKSRLLQAMRNGDESAMDELISRGWLKVGEQQTTFFYRQGIDLPPTPVETQDDKVMDRVAKIIALKMNAGTVEEAEAAAAMAQKMAFKYNLDLAAIEAGLQSGTGTAVKKIIKGMIDLGPHKAWVEDLANVIARANFCRVVFHGKSDRMSVVGERHNLLIVDYMLQFLRRTIDRLADDGWAKNKHEAWATAINWKTAFREGAVAGVQIALSNQRKADLQEHGNNGSALVVLKDREVEQGMTELFPNLRYGKVRKVNSGEGYWNGYDAGKSIQVNKGVEQGQRRTAGLVGSGR